MTDFHSYGLICCICFSGLTPEQCAVDEDGQRWDVCSREVTETPGFTCAQQAGITERVGGVGSD